MRKIVTKQFIYSLFLLCLKVARAKGVRRGRVKYLYQFRPHENRHDMAKIESNCYS